MRRQAHVQCDSAPNSHILLSIHASKHVHYVSRVTLQGYLSKCVNKLFQGLPGGSPNKS